MEHIDLHQKHLAFAITDISKVHYMRQRMECYLRIQGFPQAFISDAAIILMELGTNLLKHVKGRRHLMFRFLGDCGIEIISTNDGEPIKSIGQALEDGFSTIGTQGFGLGSVKRLSDEIKIFSEKGFGTVIIARKHLSKPTDRPLLDQLDWLCTPLEGFDTGGDAVATHQNGEESFFMVADGLGHGPEAGRASRKAVEVFHQNPTLPIEKQLEALDLALKNTRGAAIGLAHVQPQRSLCSFAGVGNISARLCGANDSKGMVSYPGIVGGNIKKIKKQEMELKLGNMLCIYSDGMKDLSFFHDFSPLLRQQATVVASAFFAKLARDSDDSTILVYKHKVSI